MFTREAWAGLRANVPLTLSDEDLAGLRGITDIVSRADVEEIYLPLTRLLNLHVSAARGLTRVTDDFLGRLAIRRPYIIGVAGSVAVGKSTFARVLRALLAKWPDHPTVELVTTDGFLLSTATLEERGLMDRKGFPESYDLPQMIAFLASVRANMPEVQAPIYSHEAYDVLPDRFQTVRRPDILIFEGLNVLQLSSGGMNRGGSVVASDFFDFSIYLDADEADIERWYIERFLVLQRTVFQRPSSYFHHFRNLSESEAVEVARGIWRRVNLVNLRSNILPTRSRASLMMRKRQDHAITQLWLREA
ncbi:type I pantothenate kinase [Geminicoccus roseus]|uniref:type I pantothenate kinase n=1 Tax=Geminicoccus roseus TaxID=404900 RepID=UPI000416B5C6|nr:type I pantothenate kinase [Geminicoccus roseus]